MPDDPPDPLAAATPEPACDPAAVLRLVRPRPDDEALVAGLRRMDPASARAFHDAFAPRVNRLVWRLLGADPDHDDVVQQVLIVAVTSIGELAAPAALGAWVTGVTLNVVRRELRRRARRRWLTFSDTPPDPVDTGASALDHAILRSFYRVLSSMRPDDQIVLTLRLVEGCTLPEIAAAQGISVATVKRHFSAALARLQRRAARDFWLADVLKEAEEEPHDA